MLKARGLFRRLLNALVKEAAVSTCPASMEPRSVRHRPGQPIGFQTHRAPTNHTATCLRRCVPGRFCRLREFLLRDTRIYMTNIGQWRLMDLFQQFHNTDMLFIQFSKSMNMYICMYIYSVYDITIIL